VTRTLSIAALAVVALTGVASAQRGAPLAVQRGAGRVAGRGAAQQLPPAQRQALARQVRQAFVTVLRQQLKLDNGQVRRLMQTRAEFDRQRRELNQGERQTRVALRAAMEDSAGPDQQKIGQYVDQLVQAQHRRAALLESEQKELSNFLTPLQRAQYLALEERFAKKLLEAGQRGAGARGGAPPPPDR